MRPLRRYHLRVWHHHQLLSFTGARPLGFTNTAFRSIEQAEFKTLIAAHLSKPDGPLLLEGATGIGKTRAYLAAAFESRRSIAICFATNQLIDQLLTSTDLKFVQETRPERTLGVFRSRPFFVDKDGNMDTVAYEAQRKEAKETDILVCTTSSVIFDQRLAGAYNGATERDAIVFDEADQIPGLAALSSDLEIDRRTLLDLKATGRTPLEVVDRLLAIKKLEPEIRARAMIVKEVAQAEPVWYRRVGMTDDGGIAVRHRLPGRLLKKISNRPSSIFISATLSVGGSLTDFTRAMGIQSQSPLSKIVHPERHGKLYFSFCVDHPVDSPEWLGTVVDEITCADGPTLGRCCITLTAEDSHRESMRLDGLHEQAITRPLSHDELVQLLSIAAQARVAADLAGQGDDLARAA